MADYDYFSGPGQWPGPLGMDPKRDYIDDGTSCRALSPQPGSVQASTESDYPASIPGRAFFFVAADEMLPSGKLVLKVLQFPVNPQDFMLANPEIYGIEPPQPGSPSSPGEHALGSNNSRYTSASSKPGGSSRPIVAESVRQVGGWGSGVLGLKIGFIGDAAVGIETGPGAIITGGIGALIFGAAGYFGADWVADLIYEN